MGGKETDLRQRGQGRGVRWSSVLPCAGAHRQDLCNTLSPAPFQGGLSTVLRSADASRCCSAAHLAGPASRTARGRGRGLFALASSSVQFHFSPLLSAGVDPENSPASQIHLNIYSQTSQPETVGTARTWRRQRGGWLGAGQWQEHHSSGVRLSPGSIRRGSGGRKR